MQFRSMTMNLQLQSGYFSIKTPLQVIDSWLNPYHHKGSIDIRGKEMTVWYSERAEKALKQRKHALIAELQLYFTCVVQKRVLFHESSDLNTLEVNEHLKVAYHTVQSNNCDPIEFAEKHPVKNELISKGASSMRPSTLKIDFKNDEWQGEFYI